MKVRLNKYLADAGVASRRAADELIRSGKVAVDGQRAHVGLTVDPQRQRISVNGKQIDSSRTRERTIIVLNKPLHVITTMRDERGRRSVAHYLPQGRRLFPVGRLDAETTGVLLCTDDGDLSNALLHPSREITKIYRVVVRGEVPADALVALTARDVRRAPQGDTSFEIALHEGKNRQVRRMCAQQGLKILSLTRTRFGPVSLGNLKPGAIREVNAAERRELERIRANAGG